MLEHKFHEFQLRYGLFSFSGLISLDIDLVFGHEFNGAQLSNLRIHAMYFQFDDLNSPIIVLQPVEFSICFVYNFYMNWEQCLFIFEFFTRTSHLI